jgi:hypothetical protein
VRARADAPLLSEDDGLHGVLPVQSEQRRGPAETLLHFMLIRVSKYLADIGAEPEARKLSRTPVNVSAGLACVFAACRAVDQSLRIRWGRLGTSEHATVAPSVEMIALINVAAISVVANDEPPLEWLRQIEERIRRLSRRFGGKNGSGDDADRKGVD